MPHPETVALSGTIQHVFAHRFTIAAGDRIHLADLSPKGVAAFPIAAGLIVTLEGGVRPSEIKVSRIVADGRSPVDIEHKKPHHATGHKHADDPADPERVLSAVRNAGWSTLGEPRRKPKHFEVLARGGDGQLSELHVDFAGTIHKEKAADLGNWGIAA